MYPVLIDNLVEVARDREEPIADGGGSIIPTAPNISWISCRTFQRLASCPYLDPNPRIVDIISTILRSSTLCFPCGRLAFVHE